jgi:piRNA pathway germ-plasm component
LHFYKEADVIYPAELALAKFSLKRGVYAKISFPINPGILPINPRFNAEQIAKESHNYPLPEDQPKTPKTNYIRLLMKILHFLHPLDRLPVFFAMGFRGIPKIPDEIQVIEDTNQVLSYIFEQAGEYELASKLKVYSVYELLYELKRKIVEFKQKQENFEDAPFASIPYTIDKFKMSDSKFEYLTKGCAYHDNMDVSKHCCLAKVQRFGFVITQWCNQMEKNYLKPNRHYPYVI